MFRIVCDPSSGSTELCLTEITRGGSQIFFVCLVGFWQRNFNCNMKVDVNWTFCNRITFLASYFPSYLRPYTLSRIEYILFVLFYHWIFFCDDFIIFEFLAVNSWKRLLIRIGGRLPNLFPLKPVKASLPYIIACSDTSRQRLVIPN